MRTVLKWSFLAVAAIISAAIPTPLSSHGFAVGFPFAWHTRQEVITLGEQPHSFSFLFQFLDCAMALLCFLCSCKDGLHLDMNLLSLRSEEGQVENSSNIFAP